MNPDIIIPTCKNEADVAPLLSELQGQSLGCRTFATCRKVSAAINRNLGLVWAQGSIAIMVDDDIAGFSPGWWRELVRPLEENPNIAIVSARLMKPSGGFGPMMFGGDKNAPGITDVPRCPTACIAFRNDGTRFNEAFIGCGFEDDDFCAQLARRYPASRVVINNRVRVFHANEMKNQIGDIYEKNKRTFDGLWKTICGGTVRVDHYWNIPKIINFVWIGPPMPEFVKRCIDEFRRLNPEFEVVINGEDALDPIFKSHYSKIERGSDHEFAIKSDLIRLSVIKKTGGWYWDTDFWPLISIREMCDRMDSIGSGLPFKKTILFNRENMTANGCIACTAGSPGIEKMIGCILRKDKIPEWWDYGTAIAREALREVPDLFCALPLNLIIPHVGKEAAHACVRDLKLIEETKTNGAWAVHLEMTSSTEEVEIVEENKT